MNPIAITGLGLVSALGRGIDAHARALATGATGLGQLRLFALEGIPPSAVGEVTPEHLAADPGLSRSEALALAAARDALADARLVPSGAAGTIAVGTTTGGIESSERHYLRHRGAEGREDRDLLRRHPAGCVADRLAVALSLLGERHTFSTACSSSANSIGYAAMRVAAGAPWALAGGVDSLCRLTFAGFHSLKLLSAVPCKPFDRTRLGLSLGEAAAFLVLEPEAVAKRRGAAIHGYIAGWGTTADAYHPTAPEPSGRGATAAMQQALADAGIAPADVDYVNAHGTATPANDKAETAAIRAVFGGPGPLMSSTKGATGHTLGAAGAIEAAFCTIALERGFAPATVGLVEPDPELGVTHVPKEGLRRPLRTALSNSFGFGGNNAALVLTREAR